MLNGEDVAGIFNLHRKCWVPEIKNSRTGSTPGYKQNRGTGGAEVLQGYKMKYTGLLLLVLITISQALPHYASSVGRASWAASQSGSPLNDTFCCSWQTVNTGIRAGDTVYYRGGTYSLSGYDIAISPDSSGTIGHPITFLSYLNEDVIFNNSYFGISINCDAVGHGGTTKVRKYILISGISTHPIQFTKSQCHLFILNTSNIEIRYCSFLGMGASDPQPYGAFIYMSSSYIWVHNCRFIEWGTCTPFGTDVGDVFKLGINDAEDSLTRYNLVENNELAHGGHMVMYVQGTHNIVRNNYIHNEPWFPTSSPTFATRIMCSNGWSNGWTGDNTDGIYNLFEGNRIGYGGPKNKDEAGGNVAQVMGAHNTWRYNIWAQSYLSSIWLYCYEDYGEVTRYNHVYNNTFWKGGYGYYQDYYDPSATTPTTDWAKSFHSPVNCIDDTSTYYKYIWYNTFKNNLFYQNNTNGTYSIGGYHDFVDENDTYTHKSPDKQNIVHNFTDSMGDPGFNNISASANPAIDPSSQWDFGLRKSSKAVDSGIYLATANGSGNSSTILVLNTETLDPKPASAFFYDVGKIDSVYPTSNVHNDWICVGTVSDSVAISSINYETNTLTLTSPKTWSNGAYIWLYKRSDGARVLYGTTTDYGAIERDPNQHTKCIINIVRP